MLIEIAIGDAYGAAFEYVDSKFTRENNDLSGYYKHPRHDIAPGCYTDDTQMSIAIAEALLDGRKWSADLIAEHFVGAFKRDPREGYAGNFYLFLQKIKDHEAFLRDIKPESDKSGASMRACPLGLLPTIDEVIEYSRIQAAVTHNTPDGIAAAIAAALTSHYFIYHLGGKSELGAFLESHINGQWNVPWKGKVGSKGWMSVRAAITAIKSCNCMSDLLKTCINFEGDVDTVAAIALGAASCSDEIEQDLPQVLFEELENKDYGRDYIIDLDQRLMNSVAR